MMCALIFCTSFVCNISHFIKIRENTINVNSTVYTACTVGTVYTACTVGTVYTACTVGTVCAVCTIQYSTVWTVCAVGTVCADCTVQYSTVWTVCAVGTVCADCRVQYSTVWTVCAVGTVCADCTLCTVQYILYRSCQVLINLEFSYQILEKFSNIKFHENFSSVSQVISCRWQTSQS